MAAIAESHQTKMAVVSLAWLYAKSVTAPIIGATKPSYLDDAVAAVELKLSHDEIAMLEEHYSPHRIVGAILPP